MRTSALHGLLHALRSSGRRPGAAAVALLVCSCQNQTDVSRTIPKSGEEGVPSRSIVAVELSNSILDTDTAASDPRSIVVTGDLTEGRYSGTLQLAASKDLVGTETVEQFQGASGSSGKGAADTSTGTGTTKDTTKKPAPSAPKKDTIVFLLASGASFKPGETITVQVKSSITSHGFPLSHGHAFRFRVAGASGSTGDLRVVSTEPRNGQTLVPAVPRVAATFSRAAQADGIAGAITLRGSLSGVHSGGETVIADGVLQAARRVDPKDPFLPGERVDASWGPGIAAAGTSPPVTLSPHAIRFQVQGGRVRSGWAPVDPAVELPAAVALVAAEWRPASPEEVQLLVVGTASVAVLSRSAEGAWTRADAALPTSSSADDLSAVAAAAVDVDLDGVPEAAVLLSGPGGSRLAFFSVNGAGEPVPFAAPEDISAPGAAGLTLGDLDGDGKPEIIVSGAAKPPLTFLRLPAGAPAGEGSPLGLVRIADPIVSAKPSRRLEIADVSSDGRLDLVSETDAGLVLYENLVSSSAAFALRERGELKGRSGGVLRPLAWDLADFDQDGNIDAIAWDASGALFFRNAEQAGDVHNGLAGASPAPAAVSAAAGAQPSAGATARALDADGDGAIDVVLVKPDGGVAFLAGNGAAPPSFEVEDHPGAGAAGGFDLADLDGDSGLDVAVATRAGKLRVYFSQGVEPPAAAAISAFHLAPEGVGLSDLNGGTLHVVVLGDIRDRFAGYSVALTYDKSLLDYSEFQPPPAFARHASFTLCPDADLKGCPDGASARMSYLQGTRGGAEDGVVLGTFVFSAKDVTTPTTARIELATFKGADGKDIVNTVTVADGNATLEVPVDLDGGPLLVTLAPPDPSDLKARCSVLERGESDLTALVTWSSPAGHNYSQFEVSAGGAVVAVLPGTAVMQELRLTQTGEFKVKVAGTRPNGKQDEDTCKLVGIFQPTVFCSAVSVTENRITWTLPHAADSFVVYRNGAKLGTTQGDAAEELVDSSPPAGAASLYEVAAVVSQKEGPRGACLGGALGGAGSASVLAPIIAEAGLAARSSPSDPNTLHVGWTNTDGYDAIHVALEAAGGAAPIFTRDLPGTATGLDIAGDPAQGGVRPGQYEVTVAGERGGRQSIATRSAPLLVPVPPVSVDLTCALDATSRFRLTWQRVWNGYSSLAVKVEHRVNGELDGAVQELPVALEETQLLVGNRPPAGDYTFRLVAGYDDPLPPSLAPGAATLERDCVQSFSQRVLVRSVETGVGLTGVEIPVVAQAVGAVRGFHFDLEYPSFLSIDPAAGLRVEHEGARAQLTFSPGAAGETTRASVTVTGIESDIDRNGDGLADGETLLATLVASVPLDGAIAGARPGALHLVAPASLDLADVGNVSVPTLDGDLVVRRRFVTLDRASAAAGSSEPVDLTVRGTFDAPASAPGYRLRAVTIHVKWDPSLLELLPVTAEAQASTAFFSPRRIGTLQLPDAAAYSTARSTGDIQVSWRGGAGDRDFLYPGTGLPLLVLQFRPRVAADQPSAFAAVNFVSSAEGGAPTSFFPELDVPTEASLDGFFGGGVQVDSELPSFQLRSVTPAEGSLVGGGEATIYGFGFLSGGGTADNVSVFLILEKSGDAPADQVDVEEILEVKQDRIRFRIPDSKLRLPNRISTPVDLVVTTLAGSRTLIAGYSYEYPRLTGSDVAAGRADGGERMVLEGAGLAPSSKAFFTVPGVDAPIPATVTDIGLDGTRLTLLTPDLTGHDGEKATITVEVPVIATVPLPRSFTILPAEGGARALAVSSVSPRSGTICGGTEVAISGAGFEPALRVRFGGREAAQVRVLGSRSAIATTPGVPEGTGAADVELLQGAGETATLPGGFTFEQTAPAFIRGDVNEDGSVSTADGVALSALLSGGAKRPANLDAADANDDGVIDGGDLTAIMRHLFGGVAALPPPFPAAGLDPTPDELTSCP